MKKISILTVPGSNVQNYQNEIKNTLNNAGFQVTVDDRTVSLAEKCRKIRSSADLPALIIGEKERESQTAAIWAPDGTLSQCSLEEIIQYLNEDTDD